jgi:hypothetical protein
MSFPIRKIGMLKMPKIAMLSTIVFPHPKSELTNRNVPFSRIIIRCLLLTTER